jgi:hypothetical protein
VQQSKITALAPITGVAGTPTPLVISGSFVEKLSAIQINGTGLAAGSWTQTPTSITFTVPNKSAGSYQIQLFNGSVPLLAVQSFTVTAPSAVVTSASDLPTKSKVSYLRCTKPGHGIRIAFGINPTCPTGYLKK